MPLPSFHIARILFFAATLSVACPLCAQYAPWTVSPTSAIHQVIIPSDAETLLGGEPLETDDAIGAFYVREGQWVCAGYAFWSENGAQINVYGEEGAKTGFQEGETLRFRVWRASRACLASEVTPAYAPPPEGDPSFTQGHFAEGRSSVLRSLRAERLPVLAYPKPSLCSEDGFVAPLLDGAPVPEGMAFSAEQGLAIDPQTGVVDVLESAPGDYQVHVEYGQCLQSEIVEVNVHVRREIRTSYERAICPGEEIRLQPEGDYVEYLWEDGSTKPYLDVDEPGFYYLTAISPQGCPVPHAIRVHGGGLNLLRLYPKTIDGTCETPGSIVLDNSASISEGSPPYIFCVEGRNDPEHRFYSQEPVFEELPADEYELFVIEGSGCRTAFPRLLVVDKPDNCEDAVLTPNRDGISDYLHIPFYGTSQIVNRNGKVVLHLQTPARWDGRDSNGEIVPMGLYIVRSGSDWMRVTVVR